MKNFMITGAIFFFLFQIHAPVTRESICAGLVAVNKEVDIYKHTQTNELPFNKIKLYEKKKLL